MPRVAVSGSLPLSPSPHSAEELGTFGTCCFLLDWIKFGGILFWIVALTQINN